MGVPVVLIAVSNLSTAIVVAGIGMVIIFVASPKVWYFIVAIVPIGAAGVIAVSLPQFAYRFSRIKVWRDPFSDPLGKGFQTILTFCCCKWRNVWTRTWAEQTENFYSGSI